MNKELSETNIEFLKKSFLNVRTLSDLANVLEVKTGHLYYWLNVQKNKEKYKKFIIKKKSGKDRTIYAPQNSFKIIQRKLNKILSLFYNVKQPVHGFVKNKNIITNATYHTETKLILNIDLQDFFQSINQGRVFGIFRNKPFEFPIYIAKILSKICCCSNFVPQGAPTSPIISNFVCRSLDNDLTSLAQYFKCKYSRYADDITFSTYRKEFSKELTETIYDERTKKPIQKVGNILNKVITKHGFKINEEKVRVLSKGHCQTVTGLTINEKVNLKRSFIKNTRSMLYNWQICKLKGESLSKDEILNNALKYHLLKNPQKQYEYIKNTKCNFRNIILGRINFIKDVRGKNDFIYAKLINKFNILDENGKKHLPENYPEWVKNNLWIIETNESQGTAFLLKGVGFITCYHCLYDINKKSKYNNIRLTQNAVKWYKDVEIKKFDYTNDIVIFNLKDSNIDINSCGFDIGDSTCLTYGSKIVLAGFPERGFETEPEIKEVIVSRRKPLHGVKTICINSPIIYGNSGGPVFNMRKEIVGIAVYGSSSTNADKTSNHAFIPSEIFQSIMQ